MCPPTRRGNDIYCTTLLRPQYLFPPTALLCIISSPAHPPLMKRDGCDDDVHAVFSRWRILFWSGRRGRARPTGYAVQGARNQDRGSCSPLSPLYKHVCTCKDPLYISFCRQNRCGRAGFNAGSHRVAELGSSQNGNPEICLH